MTKEEALKKVEGYLTDYLPTDCYEEVEEIVNALKQEPTIKNDLASESMSKEMIAARTLESINEGFNKGRLLDSWFGDNRKRDVAFKRAILALRAIDKMADNMEEYLFNCLSLPPITSMYKECPNCGTDISGKQGQR